MATRLGDGRWQARYRPKDGEPKVWHSWVSAEDAERQKTEYLDEIKGNRPAFTPSTADTLVQDYAKNAWWPRVEAGTNDSTQKRYMDVWRLHVRPEFGALALKDVTYEQTQTWVARMRQQGVSANEIRLRRGVLSMVLNLAVKNGIIARNPAGDVKMPSPEQRRRVMKVSKAIEVLRAVDGSNMAAPVFCALVLGMRRGEATGLRWENVDMEERRVTIVEQRRRIRTGTYAIGQRAPKRSSSVRSYVLPQELFDMLQKVGNLDSGWVCTARGKRPWNPEKLTEKWKDLAPGLGLSDWTYHDLRHATAGLLVGLGVDLLTVAAILGHSNIDTTMLYSAAQEATATRGLKTLATALFPSTSQVDEGPRVASN